MTVQLRLYRPVKVIGQDLSKEKVITVPNQSMTLHEIIQRFTRRESLPVMQNGTYREDMGDLEKLSKEDITVQMERVEDLRTKIKNASTRMKQQEEKRLADEAEKQKAAQAAKPPETTPVV